MIQHTVAQKIFLGANGRISQGSNVKSLSTYFTLSIWEVYFRKPLREKARERGRGELKLVLGAPFPSGESSSISKRVETQFVFFRKKKQVLFESRPVRMCLTSFGTGCMYELCKCSQTHNKQIEGHKRGTFTHSLFNLRKV